MRPPTASDPDGPNGWRYRELADVDGALAQRLFAEYGEIWLSAAELPVERRTTWWTRCTWLWQTNGRATSRD